MSNTHYSVLINYHRCIYIMFNIQRFILLAGFLLLTNVAANGKQISFNKSLVEQGVTVNYQFGYQWQNASKEQHSLVFQLPQQAIFDRYRNFRKHNNNHLKDSVDNALQKHFASNPETDIKGQLNRYANANNVNKLTRQFQLEYLSSAYYHEYITHHNSKVIKPNHSRIAIESVSDLSSLKPIILEQASSKNIRKVTNYILSFIQSIPDTKLASRSTSPGGSFAPPLKLLWQNEGDCDSKITLAASLLRTLMPRINISLIFIDKHALMGINIAPQKEDITIQFQGVSYVVAEAKSAAPLPLGKLTTDSKQAILAGHYSVEKLPSQLTF